MKDAERLCIFCNTVWKTKNNLYQHQGYADCMRAREKFYAQARRCDGVIPVPFRGQMRQLELASIRPVRRLFTIADEKAISGPLRAIVENENATPLECVKLCATHLLTYRGKDEKEDSEAFANLVRMIVAVRSHRNFFVYFDARKSSQTYCEWAEEENHRAAISRIVLRPIAKKVLRFYKRWCRNWTEERKVETAYFENWLNNERCWLDRSGRQIVAHVYRLIRREQKDADVKIWHEVLKHVAKARSEQKQDVAKEAEVEPPEVS